ncbi:formate/nitrite transporter family protein [Candidatus Dojkabacteria bacterium]|nr:formate/nitrite transporter family protein [Candidatus Dojkabacteria bacterium]
MTHYKTIKSKSYTAILNEALEEGHKELVRPAFKLFLSAFSAGLDLSLSILLISAFLGLTLESGASSLSERIGVSILYSVGFIFVVIGRSELFTEHTTLSILPVIDRKASILQLLRVWGIVLFGNLTGVTIFAFLTLRIGFTHGVVNDDIVEHIRHTVLDTSDLTMFFSAILAGWLMGLLAWLVHASKETLSDIVIVFLITATIGFLQLHHSVIGSGEVLLALFSSGAVTVVDFLSFFVIAVVGNTIGGSLFVGVLKYSHAKKLE